MVTVGTDGATMFMTGADDAAETLIRFAGGGCADFVSPAEASSVASCGSSLAAFSC